MSALVVATRVELLKLRRTLALAVAVAVPIALLGMLAANILSRDPGAALPGGSPWNALIVNFAYFLWCVLAWPLLVTLQTALLAGFEHSQHHWKDLFALPIPRWSIYGAKLIVGVLLLAVSLVVLGLGLALEGVAAQNADATTKPITLAFALIGLYLLLERSVTGRQVQRVHMLLANRRKQWPRFDLPADRGTIWPSDVLAAPPGRARYEMIVTWCASVWQAYSASRAAVLELIRTELG